MRDFRVYEEHKAFQLPEAISRSALPTIWVERVKNGQVRMRLVCQGFYQSHLEKDDVYASTPLLPTLKFLLAHALQRGYSINFADVSTAFLHADIDEEIWVVPPKEAYPNGGVLWKLRKAMYGLRSAPKAWQDHFAKVMATLGFRRLKSEPNVYVNPETGVIVLSYVDDLLYLGSTEASTKFYSDLSKHLLIRPTGDLNEDGKSVYFLGRNLRRTSEGISLAAPQEYYDDILQTLRIDKGNPTRTTGSADVKLPGDGVSLLSKEDHAVYRSCVGKILWLAPIRPDISYAVKELSRSLTEPTEEDKAKLKHLARYLRGTSDYTLLLSPKCIYATDVPGKITVYVDSDWAGCHKTRKSTTGVCVFYNDVLVHHYSRTQATVALSSAEAELYAIGTGTIDGVSLLQFVREFGSTC